MLLDLAVSDAYGSGFEFTPLEQLRKNTLSGYVKHPKYPMKLGEYSDDTQMSIAVCETLLSGTTDANAFAAKFVECFHRDKRVGYAPGFYGFLLSTKTAKEFRHNIRPDSSRNGAAMRSVPFGYLPSVTVAMKIARLQAAITHNTPSGINSSMAVTAMSYYCRNNGNYRNVDLYVSTLVPGNWKEPWNNLRSVSINGTDTAHAAIQLVKNSEPSLAALLKSSVALGGDTDSVAAIAVGCASMSPFFAHDLPQVLIDGLENEMYGRDFLIELDKKMETTFPKTPLVRELDPEFIKELEAESKLDN